LDPAPLEHVELFSDLAQLRQCEVEVAVGGEDNMGLFSGKVPIAFA